MGKILKMILERASEPSTWVGAGLVASAVGSAGGVALFTQLSTAVPAVLGVVAMVLPEGYRWKLPKNEAEKKLDPGSGISRGEGGSERG